MSDFQAIARDVFGVKQPSVPSMAWGYKHHRVDLPPSMSVNGMIAAVTASGWKAEDGRLVINLPPGTYPTRVLDVLMSPPWDLFTPEVRHRIEWMVAQVLLDIDDIARKEDFGRYTIDELNKLLGELSDGKKCVKVTVVDAPALPSWIAAIIGMSVLAPALYMAMRGLGGSGK